MSDDDLMAAAATALGVALGQPLRAGGQKLVRLASAGGDTVVVKVAKVHGTSDPDALERAHREAELLSHLSHPNIVGMRSHAVDLGAPVEAVCWLEEYVDGVDLIGLLSTSWSPDEVTGFLRDVAGGLAAMHEAHVVHRDLSPGNVMRRAAGGYTILDPGFAKHLDRTTITNFGQPGTNGYKSPEHVDIDNGPCPASDVFTAGILAFRCLTGRLPIDLRDPRGYPIALRDGQAPRIRSVDPTVPAPLAAVIDRALERQLARRWRSGRALLDALEALP